MTTIVVPSKIWDVVKQLDEILEFKFDLDVWWIFEESDETKLTWQIHSTTKFEYFLMYLRKFLHFDGGILINNKWTISYSKSKKLIDLLTSITERKTTHTQVEPSNENKRTPEWRNKVIKNDNHTCQCCGLTTKLEAHHIYGYKLHPQYREDPNNGITLCKYCHQRYHTLYGVKEKVNPKTLLEYMKHYSSNQMR